MLVHTPCRNNTNKAMPKHLKYWTKEAHNTSPTKITAATSPGTVHRVLRSYELPPPEMPWLRMTSPKQDNDSENRSGDPNSPFWLHPDAFNNEHAHRRASMGAMLDAQRKLLDIESKISSLEATAPRDIMKELDHVDEDVKKQTQQEKDRLEALLRHLEQERALSASRTLELREKRMAELAHLRKQKELGLEELEKMEMEQERLAEASSSAFETPFEEELVGAVTADDVRRYSELVPGISEDSVGFTLSTLMRDAEVDALATHLKSFDAAAEKAGQQAEFLQRRALPPLQRVEFLEHKLSGCKHAETNWDETAVVARLKVEDERTQAPWLNTLSQIQSSHNRSTSNDAGVHAKIVGVIDDLNIIGSWLVVTIAMSVHLFLVGRYLGIYAYSFHCRNWRKFRPTSMCTASTKRFLWRRKHVN
jgi:hypothetical protein